MNNNMKQLNTPDTPWFLYVLIWGLIISISLYSLFLFLHYKFYYFDSDVFYYLSISDSLEQTGQFRNLTVSPPQPPITPQNGIVAIYYLMDPIFSSNETKIKAVVVLNYIALLVSIFPLLKIIKFLKINSLPAKISILAIYLCGWHMIRFQLSPINDGLFRTGSLWLIYWLIHLHINNWDLIQLCKKGKGLLLSGCVLSILVIHFRLNAAVIPVAGLLGAVLIHNKKMAWISFTILVLMVFSLILPYTFIQISKALLCYPQSAHEFLQALLLRAKEFLGEFPKAVFCDLGRTGASGNAGNILYSVFIFAILTACYKGYRKREYEPLFLGLICIGTFIYLALFIVIPYRYFLMVFPLLYLLLFYHPSLRPIGYLFVLGVLFQSLLFFYDGNKLSDKVEFWKHVSRNVTTEPSDYLLITKDSRHAYYFGGKTGRFGNIYTWQDILKAESIYIAGTSSFIQEQKKILEDLAHLNNSRIDYHCLTPNYSDAPGHTMVCAIIQNAQ